MKALIFVFLAAGSILSADIVTTVTCDISGSPSTEPHSCSLQGPTQPVGGTAYAMAMANAAFSLASDPNSFSSLSTGQSASATGAVTPSGGSGTALSLVSVNEALLTTGSVRSGFVQVIIAGGSDYYYGDGQMDLSLGSVTVRCPGNRFALTGCILSAAPYTPPEYNVPVFPSSLQEEFAFTLGQPFNFNFSGKASAYGNTGPPSGGDAFIQFQFRFFEADGVTPVAVAAPEPATFALFGIALGVLAAGKGKLRRCCSYQARRRD